MTELKTLRSENDKIMQRLETASYDGDKLRDIAGTAEYLGTTPGAVKALIKRGELYCVRIGNSDFIAQSQIHDFLERSHKAQDNAQYRQNLAKRGNNYEQP